MILEINSLRNIFVVLIMLFASLLGAVTDTEYKLEELIELGLEHSVNTQTESLRLQNSHSSLITSYLDFLPSATINVSRNYSDIDTESAGFNLNKSLSLNEPTYFNWRRTNIDWDNAQLMYEQNTRQTVFDIFSNFVRVIEAQKRIEIQQKNLIIQQRILEQTELLHRLEQRSMIELKQAQIGLINAQIALGDAELQLDNARENLFLFINIEDKGYPLADTEISLMNEVPPYTKPVEIVTAENELKKSALSLTQSRLDFLPNISLSYTYSHRHSTELGNDLFDFNQYNDSYTISLSASYSLFNLAEHRQRHHRNQRNVKVQHLMLDNLINSKEQDYERMIREWEREIKLYDLAEKRNELAQETLNLAQTRFNLGTLSLLELEQATRDYLESNIEVNTRFYQRILKQEEINLFLSRQIMGKW